MPRSGGCCWLHHCTVRTPRLCTARAVPGRSNFPGPGAPSLITVQSLRRHFLLGRGRWTGPYQWLP